MSNLRRKFEAFCIRNRDRGIPNLMLYICAGNAVLYVMSQLLGNNRLYVLLCFDRASILRGQLWRLFTYPLTAFNSNLIFMFISLWCYYVLGRSIENRWGTCKFNLFYLSGLVLLDAYALIFGCQADAYFLNTSLFLTFSTLYPDMHFLVLFVIPIRAWIFALFTLVEVVVQLFGARFPYNLVPLVALVNYFVFLGKDVLNVLPVSWQIKLGRKLRKAPPKVIRFNVPQQSEKPDYNHRCTVCGRTDTQFPNLEFRYCSRCRGYHCYCEEHIGNHAHIE